MYSTAEKNDHAMREQGIQAMQPEPILAGTIKGIANTRESMGGTMGSIESLLEELGFRRPSPVMDTMNPTELPASTALHVLDGEARALNQLGERLRLVEQCLGKQLAR